MLYPEHSQYEGNGHDKKGFLAMEGRQLFLILRRWAWVLALGLIIGLLAGYAASNLQQPVYAASTKLLVSNQLQGKTSDFAGLNNDQLVETYIELLNTDHLREATSKKIGVQIGASQISVQRVAHTQIIELRAESHNPEQAAQIANAMVSILISENGTTRTEQYAAQEATLSKQADQVKEQIDTLQAAYEQAVADNHKAQLSNIDKQLAAIQAELSALQTEIAKLNNALTADDRAQLAEKQLRIDQLQASYKIYDEIRANLIVLGKPSQVTNTEDDPRLQEMKATISLYQDTYNQLVSNLQSTRLARLQQTPNAAQIEEASVPEKAVRPIPLLYSLLSGVVGLLLAAAPIFFTSVFREDQKPPEPTVADRAKKPKQNKNKFSNRLTEQEVSADQFSPK
jgi:uncharacterized protein involved in exopolysaccharide biosynthesis